MVQREAGGTNNVEEMTRLAPMPTHSTRKYGARSWGDGSEGYH